jgi:PKD repeat protein
LQRLRRLGAEFDGVFGPHNVAVASTRGRFVPYWTASGGKPAGLAWAPYQLNLTGYTGASCLTMHWYDLGNLTDCFLALADFKTDRWRYYQGADGAVPIPVQDLAAATAPFSGDVYVAVVIAGDVPWQLASLEAGLPANQITGVSPTAGWPGQHITLAASDNGLLGNGYWKWDLGAATADSPLQGGRTAYVQLAALGDYPCRVSFSGGNGDTEFTFTLHIEPMPAPHIIDVVEYHAPPPPGSPASGMAAEATAAATVTGGHQGDGISLQTVNDGGQAATYSWDFGGAALPAVASAPVAGVTWQQPGTYEASVTAGNAAGADTFSFQLTILPVRPPDLREVYPYTGKALWSCFERAKAELRAANYGGPVGAWHWSFPTGISPAEAWDTWPAVLAAAPGDYKCEVTAVNASGTSTLAFNLVALPLLPPTLTEVVSVPSTVLAGQDCWLTAYYGYDSPSENWSWDLGGAGTQLIPSAYATQLVPTAPGIYNCSVTASNAAGSATLPFTLEVH